MDIALNHITIRDLIKNYEDDGDDGVRGYGGRLDIRPPYQRNFVYSGKQREAVIDTIRKQRPLNVMYWANRQDDDQSADFEIIDGQQRTISICEYATGVFSYDKRYFTNLEEDEKEDFLNYELMVYFCSGPASERLEWFKVINIAGEKLYDQELRNAVYHGKWVSEAKKYFSRQNCRATAPGKKYLSGKSIRQEYLQTAIEWAKEPSQSIEDFMAKHQKNKSAVKLWNHFSSVVEWVDTMFPYYRKEMKGLDWGGLYMQHKHRDLESEKLEARVKLLMADEEVTNKKGIYEYVLTGNEKHLNIRTFSDPMKREVYETQNGVCIKCGESFTFEEMDGDHITPWSNGGQTVLDNLQMLCRQCNAQKGSK